MLYKIAADAVVLLHFLWVLFLIFGAFIGRRYGTVRIIHLSGLSFAVVSQILGWYCPLTHLEVWLRARHDPSLSYSGSFLIHYAEKLVYIELSPGIIFLLTLALSAISLRLYLHKKK